MKAGGFGVAGAIGVGLGLASLGFSVYQYHEANVRADEMEHKQDILNAKQERKAKLMQLKEYNQALQVMNRGRFMAEQTILKEQRKKDAEEKFYGKPV